MSALNISKEQQIFWWIAFLGSGSMNLYNMLNPEERGGEFGHFIFEELLPPYN